MQQNFIFDWFNLLLHAMIVFLTLPFIKLFVCDDNLICKKNDCIF